MDRLHMRKSQSSSEVDKLIRQREGLRPGRLVELPEEPQPKNNEERVTRLLSALDRAAKAKSPEETALFLR